MIAKRTTYRASLCNSAGELDYFTAEDLETLARHLGKRLLDKSWLLQDGDTISIAMETVEQVI